MEEIIYISMMKWTHVVVFHNLQVAVFLDEGSTSWPTNRPESTKPLWRLLRTKQSCVCACLPCSVKVLFFCDRIIIIDAVHKKKRMGTYLYIKK